MKARIYEIKSSAAANAEVLRDEENDRFFWNEYWFRQFEVGDTVFFVNRIAGWAMYTQLAEKGIPTTHPSEGRTAFTYDGHSYVVDDPEQRFTSFVRFDVVQESPIAPDDAWSGLGSGEVNDLWLGDRAVEANPQRLARIQQLKHIFRDGEGARALEEIEELLGGGGGLLPKVVEALADARVRALLEMDGFHLQLGQDKLNELIAAPFDQQVLDGIAQDRQARPDEDFLTLLNSYPAGDPKAQVLRLIGEVIAYCDENAAGKHQFNQYPDKRTVARTGVRQNAWVDNLLAFVRAKGDLQAISAPSIRYALAYLKDPVAEVSITSQGHRTMIMEHLFGKPFEEAGFVDAMKQFFAPYVVTAKDARNLTAAMGQALYADGVRERWYGITGLICVDSGTWFQDALHDFRQKRRIVLWWSRVPAHGQRTIRQLKQALQRDGYFELYYTRGRSAHHRARIIDFAFANDYPSKRWDRDGAVAWHEPTFEGYRGESPNGTMQQAKVVFLADAFEPVEPGIPVDAFRFVETARGLTQSNLLPFVSVEGAPEWNDDEIRPQDQSTMSLQESLAFQHEHRAVLSAIRTKPFILLAGISGTGKSRLVRSLAYLTCSDRALQHPGRPGNFELVMVKPNWHDPTELMGYVSRITGAAEYVPKDFLRFVIRAWEYPHVPFFLCLDEMNLAPVEQYFADFLSVVETRRRNTEGHVVTDALLKADASVPAPVFEDLLGKLGLEPGGALWDRFMNDGITLPPNLVVMGTVNMDETTHSFSRKVLDRAMTFEMNEVDLRGGLGQEDEGWRYPEMPLAPTWVLGTVTRGGEVPPDTEGYNETLDWLEKMNSEVLEGTPFKVAYRVRDEYLAYVFHNAQLAAKPKEWLATCLDELLVMKVLSRIEGDEGKVKDVLDKLLALVPEQWPHSTRKLKEMKARLERSGYTSFWS